MHAVTTAPSPPPLDPPSPTPATAPVQADARVVAQLRGAVKRYGALLALDHVDLHVRAGEVLAVLGANGAGKTTALGLLTGRLGADSGEALLLGQDPRDPAVRRDIGVMLQDAALPDTLQVAEQIHLFSSYYPSPRPLQETLALAGLEGLGKRRYAALSGGQQRRVQFALAICGRPRLLFVDEPTVGLDVEARRNFWRVLRQLRDEGAGIVLTTHYLEEADALADRIVLMAAGRVLAEDSPAGIKSRALGKRVAARSRLSLQEIEGWSQVDSASVVEGVIEVRTNDAEGLLRHWLAMDPALCELAVGTLSLEDAFLSLTASETTP